MKKILFDCDNTFGVPDCDVDDGLALLYLLGDPKAELLGVTATYGNNCLDTVYDTSRKMLKELGREDIPLKKGGPAKGDYDSEAASFLAETAARFPGEVSILATGSLTNLCGAYKKDSRFFENIKEIVLMGGITEPLVFEKKVMDELNFSCDPHATYLTLTLGKKVSVVTGNHCLKVLFTRQEYRDRLFSSDREGAVYIRTRTDYWFGYNEEDYGIPGFYNWDVTAAVYLMHPELFTDHRETLQLSEEDLQTGFLRREAGGTTRLNLPQIGEEQAFKDNIYANWMRVPVPGIR
ncbi:nucleoside hydrolase [uncultured Merdimonas sp.]|uniref:nucleoside hydrolase n=1 Tax=uncultured Merdimonas sp. TaxID=2023269 RepID=UPI00320964A6